jgi:single-stranded-DNA-specific exonuclease
MEKVWKIKQEAPESFFNKNKKLAKIVANLLYNRNITETQDIEEFLNPDYEKNIQSPFVFSQMKKTCKRIFEAIKNNEKIIIHGDYDADGVTSAAILFLTLENLGAKNIDVYIPHRETEGYGLNKETIEKLAEEKTNLIITCDCGVSNFPEVELANKKNIDVIITDHHEIPEKIPNAYSIIHAKLEKKYSSKDIAGCAVAFKLAQGLLQTHKKENTETLSKTSHEYFEKWLLDLVAIGTIADMVPLVKESRTLTKFGMLILNRTKRVGIQKLLLESRLVEEDGTKKQEISTDMIGFQIAPRLNAAGRMNHANVAYNLLVTKKATDAIDLSFELNNNNQERQKLTEELVAKVIADIEKRQKNKPVIFFVAQNWSTGIVGLIAGKIKEKYYKPTLILTQNNNEITGSGRSIEGFNIIECLQEMPEIFDKFGGHPMACGFTLKSKDFLFDFEKKIIEKFQEKTKNLDMSPVLNIDMEIDINEIDENLFKLLEKFKPFGKDNEKPKFLARNLEVFSFQGMGKESKHLKIMIKKDKMIKKFIGWNLCDEDENKNKKNWCKKLKIHDKIDVVFEVNKNEWNGNTEIQFMIIDLKKSIRQLAD